MVSVATNPGADYPSPRFAFSPSEAYPEYGFPEIAPEPNAVYAMVRQAFRDAGLDAERLGTPAWNPLGAFLREGQTAFLLANFVYHRRPQESAADFHAKCTHGSVLRAVADYALKAVGPAGRVLFGNAALQSCDWKAVLDETGASDVVRFYRDRGLPVEARDLRLRVAHRSLLGRVTSMEWRDETDAVEIDLGRDSLLASIPDPTGRPRFRVSDYDPRRIEAFHHAGSHRYVIHRDVLRADAIISVPKLKTHEKVGITCSLKGFVGAVAHKDCLAHHRFGPPARGGDEYPDSRSFLRPLSAFHDWVNRRPRGAFGQGSFEIADRTARRLARRLAGPLSGAWHGNDTAWRMSLDLARILHHADREGVLRDTLERRHVAVIDGIVGGEGNGPLAPRPRTARLVLFADDVVEGDAVACRLMGFDPARVPLVARARDPVRWPLAPASLAPGWSVDGRPADAAALARVVTPSFAPPAGWRGIIEGGA